MRVPHVSLLRLGAPSPHACEVDSLSEGPAPAHKKRAVEAAYTTRYLRRSQSPTDGRTCLLVVTLLVGHSRNRSQCAFGLGCSTRREVQRRGVAGPPIIAGRDCPQPGKHNLRSRLVPQKVLEATRHRIEGRNHSAAEVTHQDAVGVWPEVARCDRHPPRGVQEAPMLQLQQLLPAWRI